MKNITLFVFLCIAIVSCGQTGSKKPRYSQECIDLNNDGFKYMMKPSVGDYGAIDTAIVFFQQAIHCDANYPIPYGNLANAYDQKHEYKAAILIYDKLLLLTNNSPDLIVQKAELFEKNNQIDSAKKTYSTAFAVYNKKLSTLPNDLDAIKGLIYLKALTINSDTAMNELNRQIKNHPDLATKLSYDRFLYEHFDRQQLTGRAAL